MDTHAHKGLGPEDPNDADRRLPTDDVRRMAPPAGDLAPGPSPGRIVGPPKNGTPAAKKRGSSQAKKARPIGSPKPPAVRVSLRSPTQRSTFLQVAHRITERDIQIFFDLHQHRVLTTHQITELHFNSPRVATRRLTALWEMGFIERFQPQRPTGSNPYHYVLSEAGAFVVAARMGRDFHEFSWARTDLEKAPFNPHLAHLVEANSFFTRLASAYRRSGGRGELVEWANGYEPSFRWAVIPDGLGLIKEGSRTLRFAYEHDRSTETSEQLTEKVERYFNLSLAHSQKKQRDPTVVLFTFPSARRERNARPHLDGSGFPLATAVYSRVMNDRSDVCGFHSSTKYRFGSLTSDTWSLSGMPPSSASRGNGAGHRGSVRVLPPSCFRSVTKTGK